MGDSAIIMFFTAVFVLALAAPAFGRLPYIVNGRDAEVGAWPWQASLQMEGQHFCGGVLISEQWVLTAAHCVVLGPQGPFQVVMGLHDQTQQYGQPETYNTATIIMYANFILNDIALIKLSTKVNMNNPLVSIANMAGPDAEFEGNDCRLIGWGRMSGFENAGANTLQEVDTTAISGERCESLWAAWGFKIRDSHICFYNGKGGACQGDSGGPAVCYQNGGWVLAGVTSGGSPVCNVRRPSIYARVSAFRNWISTHSNL